MSSLAQVGIYRVKIFKVQAEENLGKDLCFFKEFKIGGQRDKQK